MILSDGVRPAVPEDHPKQSVSLREACCDSHFPLPDLFRNQTNKQRMIKINIFHGDSVIVL